MTTLYRPVLIESAEQAEALPVGTVAYDPRVGAAVRVGYGLGWSVTGDPDTVQSGHMLGFTALVPIEAEEEWTPMVNGHAYVNGKKSEAHVRATVAEWPGAKTGHRLVTLWEEA